jgi:hypothetical protein
MQFVGCQVHVKIVKIGSKPYVVQGAPSFKNHGEAVLKSSK